MWFILWRPHASRVQNQTARLAVLDTRARWSRVERVRPTYRGREVVHDQADGDAPEESPRFLQTLDRGFHRLLDQWPEEAVAAVDQNHQEPPDHLAVAGDRVDERPQLAEIHLGHFTRRRRRHAHRRPRLLPQASLAHVAPQRRVGDCYTLV